MNGLIAGERRNLILLLLVVAALWFGSLGYRHLVQPDEGRYAEIPREMVASGDWLTPRLNDLKYFEKPALQYWATAAAYRVFGEHEWTARLWSALTGFLGIVLVYFTGRRIFGAQAGLFAALVLASSLLYVVFGHINTLDMGVTFFMTLGLAGFLRAQYPAARARENKLWMHIAWAALAFAVLSKGLMGLALPGAVLVVYTLIQRDWVLWKRLHLVSGLALFLAISAPWFIAVTIANPEFFRFFFIYEHFERFLFKAHGRYHPWWYFVPILLAGILPWLVLTFDALARAWKQDGADKGAFRPKRFLLIWVVFIYVFFTLSNSKLPGYILPIFPALALLMGQRLTQISGKTLFWQTVPILFLAAAGLGLAPWIANLGDQNTPPELYAKYANWVVAAALVWLIGTLVSLRLFQLEFIRRGIITLTVTGLLAAQLVLSGYESLSPSNSSYHIAQKIKPYLKPGIPFYSIGMYDQTLPFYLKRTFTLVDYQGELAFGVAQEPQKYLPDVAAFKQAWLAQPYALAIMPPDAYRQIEQEGLPMQLIARDTRRVVVRTP
jgi:4-amino-4-deoxy-L-arabinose transferase-like glycosyltransferase